MLVSAWNALTTETIVNCFHKAGISAENQDAAIAEEDDPFKDLQDEIDALRTDQPDQHALELFQKFSLFAADGDTVQSNCVKLELNIDNHFSRRRKKANNNQRLL